MSLKSFYGTFGQNQVLYNKYVEIQAESYKEAKKQMVDTYGTLWAFLYQPIDFNIAIAHWDLKKVPFGTPNSKRY